MKLVFSILFLALLGSSTAQVNSHSKDKPNGLESIKLLSEGTLIVRLSRFELDIEEVKAYEGIQKASQEETRIKEGIKDLIKEFKTDYNYSELVFAYDTDLYEYLQDSTSFIFLNDELQVDTTITLKDGPMFILSSNGSRFYQLYDHNFNLVENPNPQYINTHLDRKYKFIIAALYQSINKLFTKKISAAKLNRKLMKWSEEKYLGAER